MIFELKSKPLFSATWPKDQEYSTATSSQVEKVKRSPVSERESTNYLPDDSSGSGERSSNAEGSGIHVLKDFMLSEKIAKGLKGDPGRNGNKFHKLYIDNKRKHDKLLETRTKNNNNAPKSSSGSSPLKGDTGIISSHSQNSHSLDSDASEKSELNTNSGVLDKLSEIENKRKDILTNFDASQREGSGNSGNYEQTAERNINLSGKEGLSEAYEKHRKLYEELSRFFPNKNKQSVDVIAPTLRPKRQYFEEYDEGNYEVYPTDENDDENDEETDEELDDSKEAVAGTFALLETGDNFEGAPRSRRDIDAVVDQGEKRKLSPYPSKTYDDYTTEGPLSQPVEKLYDGKSPGSGNREPTTNKLQKLSSGNGPEDNLSLSEADYERKKNEYLMKEFGPGVITAGNMHDTDLEYGESGYFKDPMNNIQSHEDNANKLASKTVQKSDKSPHLDAAKINMKGPKIGTDPGIPANFEPEKYTGEQRKQQQKQMHKKKKGQRKYRKEGKDIEGMKEAPEWKNDRHKKVKQVSDLGGKTSSQDQKMIHKTQKHGKNHKGSNVKTGEFSEQLGKIGKAKSRRKRIKLVMEKRKRKAERSLNIETWSSYNTVSRNYYFFHYKCLYS